MLIFGGVISVTFPFDIISQPIAVVFFGFRWLLSATVTLNLYVPFVKGVKFIIPLCVSISNKGV